MSDSDNRRLQSEVTKLVRILQELGYPARSLGPLQDNLLPPNRFEFTSLALLTLIRWLETDSLPIYTSFLCEYVVDPRKIPDQTVIYLMYNALIDILHYEPKLSAEAFLDKIGGTITGELRDLHYYRVRTVRIFAKLLHDLQLRWIRHSSERMRGTDGFIVLLPPSLKPQMPYVAQRWTSHPAVIMHQPENAAYRGIVSETPADMPRIHRAPSFPSLQPHYYPDPAHNASHQINHLVDITRNAVAAHSHPSSFDVAVGMDKLPGDIQRRLHSQFSSQSRKHKRHHSSRSSSRKNELARREPRARSGQAGRHRRRASSTSSTSVYSYSSSYSSTKYYEDSDAYSTYSDSVVEEADEERRTTSRKRSHSQGRMSKRTNHKVSSLQRRSKRESTSHSKRSRGQSARHRRRPSSATRSRSAKSKPADKVHSDSFIAKDAHQRSSYEPKEKPLSPRNLNASNQASVKVPSGHQTLNTGVDSKSQEEYMSDRELLLQLGRATAKKYVTSGGEFYDTTRQTPTSLQQMSEFPASNSDPTQLHVDLSRYSVKDKSILANTAIDNADLQVNHLNAVPLPPRAGPFSAGPPTLPAVPVTSSYPPSCHPSINPVYNEPSYNIQAACPATPLYINPQRETGAESVGTSAANMPMYNFPKDGVYVPGYPYIVPTEFGDAPSREPYSDAEASALPASFVMAQRHVESTPIMSNGQDLRPLLDKHPDPMMEYMIEAEIRRAESDPRQLEEINNLTQEDNYRKSVTSRTTTLPLPSTSTSVALNSDHPASVPATSLPTPSYSGSAHMGRIDSRTNELLPAPSVTNSNTVVSARDGTSSLPPPTTTNSAISTAPLRYPTSTTVETLDDYTGLVKHALQNTPSTAPSHPTTSGSHTSQSFYDNLTSYSGKELSSSFRERINKLTRESSSTPETASVSAREAIPTRTVASLNNRILVTNGLPGVSSTPTATAAVPLMVNKYGQVQVNPDIVFPEIPASERHKPEYRAAIEAEALRQTHAIVPDTAKYHSVGDLTEDDLKKSGIAYIRESSTTSGSSSIPECVIGHLVGGGSRSTLSMTKPTVNIEAPEVALQETLTAGDKSFHKTSRQDYPDPYSVPKPFNNLPTANVSAVPSTSRSLYTHSVSIPESIPLGGNIKTAIEAITDRVEHVQSELTAATAATAAIIGSHNGVGGSSSSSASVASIRQPYDLSKTSTGARGSRRDDTPVTSGPRGDSVLSSMNTMSTKSVRFAGQDTTDSHDLSEHLSSVRDDFLNLEQVSKSPSDRVSTSMHQMTKESSSTTLPLPSTNTTNPEKTLTSNLPVASSTSQNHSYDIDSKQALIESAQSLGRTASALQRLQASGVSHSTPATSSPKEYIGRRFDSTPETTGGSLPPPESASSVSNPIGTVMSGTGSVLIPPSSTTNTAATGSSARPNLYLPSLGQSTEMISSVENPNLVLNNSTLALSDGIANSLGRRLNAEMHTEPKYHIPQYPPMGPPASNVPPAIDKAADELGAKPGATSQNSIISGSAGGSGTSKSSGGSGSSTNTIKHLSHGLSDDANGLGTLSVNAHRTSTESPPSNGLEASRIPLSGSRLRELKAQGEKLIRAANEIETAFVPPYLNQGSSTGTTVIGPSSLGSTSANNTTYSS